MIGVRYNRVPYLISILLESLLQAAHLTLPRTPSMGYQVKRRSAARLLKNLVVHIFCCKQSATFGFSSALFALCVSSPGHVDRGVIVMGRRQHPSDEGDSEAQSAVHWRADLDDEAVVVANIADELTPGFPRGRLHRRSACLHSLCEGSLDVLSDQADLHGRSDTARRGVLEANRVQSSHEGGGGEGQRRGSCLQLRPSESDARSTDRVTRRGPTCSTTSRGSTIQRAGTRR